MIVILFAIFIALNYIRFCYFNNCPAIALNFFVSYNAVTILEKNGGTRSWQVFRMKR